MNEINSGDSPKANYIEDGMLEALVKVLDYFNKDTTNIPAGLYKSVFNAVYPPGQLNVPPIAGYQAAKTDAVEFAEWISINQWKRNRYNHKWYDEIHQPCTTSELYTIFINQKQGK